MRIIKEGQWGWMMEYCKQEGIPPAQAWAWHKALLAYDNLPKKTVRIEVVDGNLIEVEGEVK